MGTILVLSAGHSNAHAFNRSGTFTYARDFTLHSPVFTDITENHTHYHIHGQSGKIALDKLSESVLVDAELHSEKRSPQPICLPGTRVNLIDELKVWMQSQNLDTFMWMFGLMGVGKSALAQTLGLWAEKEKILGAAIFFSDERNDPSHLFISIAHQLMRLNIGGPYGFRVAKALGTADNTLSSQSLSKQFNELIMKPLSGLTAQKQLVIIIDGLDECPKDKQCDIIRLIGNMANSPQSFPIRWLICSRLEHHIHREIRNVFDTRGSRKEVPLDDADVKLFLQTEFTRIANRREHTDDTDWPEEGKIDRIVTASAGLFIHASTVVQFVDDDLTPEDNLQTVLEDIDEEESSHSPNSNQNTKPLAKLDFLYHKILSRVEKKFLSTTLRLLGACAFHSSVPALILSNLLGVSREMFYAALQKLYSVVHVPSQQKAKFDHIHFFHASFVGFLKTKSRSYAKANQRWGDAEISYHIDSRQIRLDIAKVCFETLGKTKLRYARELSWPPGTSDQMNVLSLAHQVISYAASCTWKLCIELEEGDTHLLDLIVNFDFMKLRFVQNQLPTKPFHDFIEWLSKELKRTGRDDIVQWDDSNSCPFGPHAISERERCFLLGRESKAVRVHVTPTRVIIHSVED
ncbi:hypothetical protein Agabi119p4_7613 [Agaricus bisporus var. burnettii]|uniref:Nephrocystin 3-like N-terminal domain-containing protein n=1 Tax=Agaricus bisporus var. burnettii TaxID=192524 RepID=A0A8H7C8K5_AGABI|nr:hypothetical protein Agabi119p4_7613 [Agaricus bisporus var. burnettii]